MNIFTLFGTIFVDTEKANESISKTDEKAKGLANKLGDGIKTAGKWAAGIGAAAGVVGGAMLGAANKVAETTDEIDKASRRAGTSAEDWQKLNYAFRQSGIESSKLEATMIKNQKALNEAADGGKKASEAYEQLGVSIKDADGNLRNADEVYQDVLSNLADLEDKNLRNSIANDIFGKSYGDLAPLLDSGSEGIKELTDRAVDLGLVLSQDTVDAGVVFGDTMSDIKQVGGAVFNMFAAEFIPILQKLLDWVLDHMPEIQGFIKTAFDVISKVVSVAYDWFNKYLLPVFDSIFSWVSDNWPTIQKIFESVFGVIFDVVKIVWSIFSDDLLPILEALWDFISPTFPLIQGVVENTFDAIKKSVEFVVDVFERVTGAIKTAVDWLDSWNNKDAKNKDFISGSGNNRPISGSHASGLAYVPYDGYVAQVHKGEEIVKAQDKQSILGILKALTLNNNQGSQKIELVVNLDGRILARELYDPMQNESKLRGTNIATGVG